MHVSRDRISGALLGLALGDALGAPYEGGVVERLLWRLIGRTKAGEMRWTDDTQMALDLAESLIAQGFVDQNDIARRFAASYRWSRGYGPGAAKLLKRIRNGTPWSQAARSVFREGSYGNGGAMRVPVVALSSIRSPKALVEAARASAEITHAHPLGIEGAVLIATATWQALRSKDALEVFEFSAQHANLEEFKARLQIARQWLSCTTLPSPTEVSAQLGNGMAALDSSRILTNRYPG